MASLLVRAPDGLLSSSVSFSTSATSRFFTGTADSSTVDIEVSISGGAYTSDSEYIVFDGSSWTVPNPDVYPDGLPLVEGENLVSARAISSTGTVSSPVTVNAYLVKLTRDRDAYPPPTSIEVVQNSDTVEVTVGVNDSRNDIVGINFYASMDPAGGLSGYTRVNLNTISDYEMVSNEDVLATDVMSSEVPRDSNGDPSFDPIFWRYSVEQEDGNGESIAVVSSTRFEIPEDTITVKTTITTSRVSTSKRYSFVHNRSANRNSSPATVFVSSLASVSPDLPLYYVTSCVYYDRDTGNEVESVFSPEVVGRPVAASTDTRGIPVVGRQKIVKNMVESIFRSNPQIRVDPGSVLRDTLIDPASSELQRIRFLVDFLQRAGSLSGLKTIDDPDGSGVSVPVGNSTYKTALKSSLFLTRDEDVQSVIDQAFESIASNLGMSRLSGKFASGQVLFYTSRRPNQTLLIPLGTIVSGGSVQFRVLSSTTVSLSDLARYYDPVSGRYQFVVPVQATVVGSSGNIASGQVRKIISGVSGLSVINPSAMFGGSDQETNAELAERTQRAISSVDSGTAAGYRRTAAAVPGVRQVEIVAAGDDLMLRDVDSSGVHRGGKVDVWVRGSSTSTYTDRFSLQGDIVTDAQFFVVGDPEDYLFKVVDDKIDVDHPISSLLDDPDSGLGIKNMTSGEYYDLTGALITGYDTIQLSVDVFQPPTNLSDVVLGDFRRSNSTEYVLTRQPVSSIRSVTGSVSGTLPSAAWALARTSDPITTGRSVRSADHVIIRPVVIDGNTVPSGDLVPVVDEEIVFEGVYEYPLKNIGVDVLSVVVRSSDGTITYNGPGSSSPDYVVTGGDSTSSPTLRRVSEGRIASGDLTKVSYQHAEDFIVTYVVNSMVQQVQTKVDGIRHATADVLVKDAVAVPIDVSMVVVIPKNSSKTTIDKSLRANISTYFSGLMCGDAARQSDIISVVNQTPGVRYMKVPVDIMTRQDGSLVLRELASSSMPTYISGLSTSSTSVWMLDHTLSTTTYNSGGDADTFRAVVQDGSYLNLLPSSAMSALSSGVGNAYIIGSSGAYVQSLSDLTTLAGEGFYGSDEISAEVKRLTANKVLVSTSSDDSPSSHSYWVTYIASGEGTPADILTNAAEYPIMGNIEITFVED